MGWAGSSHTQPLDKGGDKLLTSSSASILFLLQETDRGVVLSAPPSPPGWPLQSPLTQPPPLLSPFQKPRTRRDRRGVVMGTSAACAKSPALADQSQHISNQKPPVQWWG